MLVLILIPPLLLPTARRSPPSYGTLVPGRPAAIWCYDGWADTDLIFNLLIADHMRTGNGGGGGE